MRKLIQAGVIAVLGLQLITPARADGAIAVGLPKGGIKNGMVYGYATGDNAEQIALRYCRGQEKENNLIPEGASKAQAACKIVGHFRNECIAIALNGGQKASATGYGWATANNLGEAKRRAIARCKEMADGERDDECYVQNSFCDGTAQ